MSDMNVMDFSSYSEVAIDSIQKAMETGSYDVASLRLASFLLEVHSRYQSGEINTKVWKEALRFYRRMNVVAMEESSLR